MSFVRLVNFGNWKRSVLGVFTHETILYLLYAYAPNPVSLIQVRLLLCRAKKGVVLPEYHFVDHRIEILSHDKDYNTVEVYENAVARPSMLPIKAK